MRRLFPSVSKRRLLALTLDASGVLSVAERLLRRPGLLVVNYHRVSAVADYPFDDATLSATPESFKQQISYLRRSFATPAVPEVVDRLCQRCAFTRPTALVTFDDGYRDNYEEALPILSSLGMPAVFFVPTAFIDRPCLPWWDRLAYVFKRTTVTRLRLHYPASFEVDLAAVPRREAIRRALGLFKYHGDLDETRFFRELEAHAHVDVPSSLGSDLFMSWAHLREAREAGIEVGSHTHTHRVLAHLSRDEQRVELESSRAILGRRLGAPADLLAYPVGGTSAFTKTTEALARESGYRAAFSFYGGFNRAQTDTAFDVRRIPVDAADDLRMVRSRAVVATTGAYR